ncbi:hypothetical protein [Psychromicrobium xiongbiense]|uniref:hypothetical protein n=1 Tax=Psychromicrobium xiongbiense TaxID=3051184 RepID=UPI002552BB9A|nr:hypothetical protein [Psychromicrobium sp. YIM S02556]
MGSVRRSLAVLFSLVILTLALGLPAHADGGDGPQWNSGNGGIETYLKIAVDGSDVWTGSDVIAPSPGHSYRFEVLCQADTQNSGDTNAFCQSQLKSNCTAGTNGTYVQWLRTLAMVTPPDWQKVGTPTCVYDQKPVDILEQIAAQIQAEFAKQPINGGVLTSQPGPHTIKGWDTNFTVTSTKQSFDLTLLGQKVHIDAPPVAYTFPSGDGPPPGPQATPGYALKDDYIGHTPTPPSHGYQDPLDYTASVSTTFTGTYTVNGGPTLTIPWQGKVTTNQVTLMVWKAVIRQVQDTCTQNPTSWGCPGT